MIRSRKMLPTSGFSDMSLFASTSFILRFLTVAMLQVDAFCRCFYSNSARFLDLSNRLQIGALLLIWYDHFRMSLVFGLTLVFASLFVLLSAKIGKILEDL